MVVVNSSSSLSPPSPSSPLGPTLSGHAAMTFTPGPDPMMSGFTIPGLCLLAPREEKLATIGAGDDVPSKRMEATGFADPPDLVGPRRRLGVLSLFTKTTYAQFCDECSCLPFAHALGKKPSTNTKLTINGVFIPSPHKYPVKLDLELIYHISAQFHSIFTKNLVTMTAGF